MTQKASCSRIGQHSKRIRNAVDQSAMTEEEIEVADIIVDAVLLPPLDAAHALSRRRYRLDTLEGRPLPNKSVSTGR